MRLVILESPYAGDIGRNMDYARAAMRDCLDRGESPIASHVTIAHSRVLDEAIPTQRQLGIDAGLAWYAAAEAAVLYLDRGMSRGMLGALRFQQAHRPDMPTEFRFLDKPLTTAQRLAKPNMPWEAGFCSTLNQHAVAEMPLGRLETACNRRPPTALAGYEVRLAGRSVAFYGSMDAAQAGAEHFYWWRAAQGAAFHWP